MYEVTVEADFSSGHYLRNYKGKCENPHGHNYKVRVTLAGRALDDAGLLLDFKLLKQVLRPVINVSWDDAKLYVREIRDADGHELFYFEIPFSKYLQSKSSQMN